MTQSASHAAGSSWRYCEGPREHGVCAEIEAERIVQQIERGNRGDAFVDTAPVTPHSLRRTWAIFAAMIGRDPKWIAQIGHTCPSFTFSVYQQVATRRYVDEQAVWSLMRFADEPSERAPSRQLTRAETSDTRRPQLLEAGGFDRAVERLNDADE